MGPHADYHERCVLVRQQRQVHGPFCPVRTKCLNEKGARESDLKKPVSSRRIEFGEMLRRLGDAQGLPQAEVARRCGLSPERYGNYVRGEREPGLDTLVRICQVLGTTPNYLLRFEPRQQESAELLTLYEIVPSHKRDDFMAGVRAFARAAAADFPGRAAPPETPRLPRRAKAGRG